MQNKSVIKRWKNVRAWRESQSDRAKAGELSVLWALSNEHVQFNAPTYLRSSDASQQSRGQQPLLPVCQISCNSCSKVSVDFRKKGRGTVFDLHVRYDGENPPVLEFRLTQGFLTWLLQEPSHTVLRDQQDWKESQIGPSGLKRWLKGLNTSFTCGRPRLNPTSLCQEQPWAPSWE